MFQSVSLPTDANPTYIMYSGGIGYVVVVLVVVAAVVFVLIFTHRYNAVRGHRAAIFPPHVYLRPSFLSSS